MTPFLSPMHQSKTVVNPITFWFFVISLVIFMPLAQAAEKNLGGQQLKKSEAPKSTQVLMQKKLHHAQNILRGLTDEDFKSIAKDAEMLGVVAKAASWYQTDSEDYNRYFKNFEEAVSFLKTNADGKNLEGVAVGYIRLTLSCMQCHNFVRAKK